MNKLHVLLALALVPMAANGCSGSSSEEPALTGEVSLRLTGSSESGRSYRLRDAVIKVSGTSSATLSSEDHLGEDSIALELAAGSYLAKLRANWFLERDDGAGFEPVNAALISENPLPFSIVDQATTDVTFEFNAGDEVVQLGNGRAEFSFEVNDCFGDDLVLCDPDLCDDGNVCTIDSFDDGECVHDAVVPTLYAGRGGPNTTSNLFVLDESDGSVVADLGDLGFAITGMAQHPATGVLYAVTSNNSVSSRSLLIVDPATAAATLVGTINAGSLTIADISFRDDGTLFGWTESGDDLVTIDPATATATIVGDYGFGTFGSGLSFDNGGSLFHASGPNLALIDPSTGARLALVAAFFGDDGVNSINAMANHPVSDVLYATDNAFGGTGTFLATVNKSTAEVTRLGPVPDATDGLAFVCP